MKSKEQVIAEFQADREFQTKRIMSYYSDLMPMTAKEFLITVMNYMISDEGIKEWDGWATGCAEHIKTITPLCPQKVWAFEEAQRQISRRQNRGDFSAIGANAFEAEYQRQLNAK